MTHSQRSLGRRNNYVLIICSLICLISATGRAQSPLSGLPFVKNFQTVEYKAGIQNWDITQDKRGILYIANNFGLLEFDGQRWRTYGVKTGTKVRSVAIDRSGKIFVGCQGDFGYFFPDSRGQLTYVSLADSLAPEYRNFDEAWSIFIDLDRVYFCTFSLIYVYEKGELSIIRPENPIDLSFLVNRQLFVNERDKGVSTLDGDQLTLMKGGEFFKGITISSILPLQVDQYLISTSQRGMFKMDNGKVTPWNEKMQTFYRDSHVNCMIRLRNGTFALGTQNSGLLVVDADGNIIRQMTRGKGLDNRTILCIYEDDLSNLWLGHNNGIAYVELGSPFTFINEQSGLPGTGYAAFLDRDQLYLGTNTGLYVKSIVGDTDFSLVENTGGQVYHIGRYGDALMLGHHQGSFYIDNKKATKISNEPGAWVFHDVKGNSDKLIGGLYAGLQRYTWSNGRWSLPKSIGGFAESSRVMEQDQAGNLWVTHGYKGAYKLVLNDAKDSVISVKHYGVEKGFPTNHLINVFKIRNELLFTGEVGVYKYDPKSDSFVPDDLFTTKLGKLAQIWFMQEDAMGNVYFVGREHIGVFQKNNIGEYHLLSTDFAKIRKYLNDDLMNIAILKNNEVLFGAKDGFIHFDPAHRMNSNTTFKTLIRNVSLTNNGVDSVLFFGNYSQGDSVVMQQQGVFVPRLPYANNSVNFTFAATSYEGDADLSYQFYLENYEKEWSAWGTKVQKEYTNLKEGTYVFHVRSKNLNGTISAEAKYKFVIRPPWYRSVWAYTFYGISVLALLFAGFNLLDRKYQREQKLMVLKQEKALNAKDKEFTKLSQQSQEEITRLQNEKLESELRHMNNELGTATMHLLTKNEFITGIKTNLSSIAKRAENDDVRKELIQITKDIEQNISGDSDWENFQFHFDRVHGDFTNRFKSAFPLLSPQEIKLSAYLRMNLSTKEIAQLLNISVRGVEISRYRLRKKLHMDRNQNLQDFILNF
ncbi:ligand-binding sensor domain-containing protein [Pseudochryseolinea flava]|uniref:Two component regulator three y domain-containing protein n=1 Tax=Pseudochryseolinea flava TaxID=2059302 RepID=A0A364Y4X2_9BACT|nr:triple tyrosine motif-containing protein [Pseudochryseolinea flava]RAW01799.1 two component regulator three y domain-containing protein [Pseudochryseolinea flava]